MTSRAHTLDRRLFGVFAGIVEDNDDPAHEGRVKVRFPWMDDGTVTEWCRVSQVYAGKGYGTLFVPEVKDEVLVALVHGDMNEPVILGGLYNGKDKPSEYKDGTKKDVKLIRTKGKHEIRLDDSANSEQVQVTSAAGHTVLLDDANETLIIKSAGGQKIEIDSAGSITVQGAMITLTGTQVLVGGPEAVSAIALGPQVMAAFNTHVHMVGLIPTTQPIAPMTPAVLSLKGKA